MAYQHCILCKLFLWKKSVEIILFFFGRSISYCNLTGSLPNSLNSLTTLSHLILTGNGISGTIPSLDALPSLKSAHLAFNRLTGTIPESIGTLTDLESMQAVFCLRFCSSHRWNSQMAVNQLSGSIPASIVELTALTRL